MKFLLSLKKGKLYFRKIYFYFLTLNYRKGKKYLFSRLSRRIRWFT